MKLKLMISRELQAAQDSLEHQVLEAFLVKQGQRE
jgi:hypothetical protein